MAAVATTGQSSGRQDFAGASGVTRIPVSTFETAAIIQLPASSCDRDALSPHRNPD
jgi:hypothetical protein